MVGFYDHIAITTHVECQEINMVASLKWPPWLPHVKCVLQSGE